MSGLLVAFELAHHFGVELNYRHLRVLIVTLKEFLEVLSFLLSHLQFIKDHWQKFLYLLASQIVVRIELLQP